MGNVVRSKTSRGEGLVPRWGRGGAWQNPARQFAAPNHSSGFSYLGVPAPAGMSDWYESMSWTPIRDALKWLSRAPANPSLRHSGEGRNPEGWGGAAQMTPKRFLAAGTHFHTLVCRRLHVESELGDPAPRK